MTSVAFADEATQKAYIEAQNTFGTLSKQLSRLNAQQAGSERESRLIAATLNELSALPETTSTFVSVGKMFLRQDLSEIKGELTQKKDGLINDVVGFKKAAQKTESELNDTKNVLKEILANAKPE